MFTYLTYKTVQLFKTYKFVTNINMDKIGRISIIDKYISYSDLFLGAKRSPKTTLFDIMSVWMYVYMHYVRNYVRNAARIDAAAISELSWQLSARVDAAVIGELSWQL